MRRDAEYSSPAHHKAGREADTAELAPTRKLCGEAARLVQLLVVSEERTGTLTALLTGAVAATAEQATPEVTARQAPTSPKRSW